MKRGEGPTGDKAIKAFVSRWKASGGAERANYTSFLTDMRELGGQLEGWPPSFRKGVQCGRVPDPQIVRALWAVPATVPRIALVVRGKLPVRLRRTARTVGRSIGTATSTAGCATASRS